MELSLPLHSSELGKIGEIDWSPGAVEQRNMIDSSGQDRVTDHRSERRDPCSSGNEEKPLLQWIVGEDERSCRSPKGQQGTSSKRGEAIPPPALRVQLDEKLNTGIGDRFFRGGCDGVRNPRPGIGWADRRELAGTVRKGSAIKPERNDARRGGRLSHAGDPQHKFTHPPILIPAGTNETWRQSIRPAATTSRQ